MKQHKGALRVKKIITTVETWCDYPDCHVSGSGTQETSTVQFWVYVSAKGRKTHPITVELCDTHRDELKHLFQSMQKYDQKED